MNQTWRLFVDAADYILTEIYEVMDMGNGQHICIWTVSPDKSPLEQSGVVVTTQVDSSEVFDAAEHYQQHGINFYRSGLFFPK